MFFTAVVNVQQLNIFSLDTFVVLCPVVAWIASVLTFVYCLIIVFQTFLGSYRPERLKRQSQEASQGMLVAAIVRAVLVVGIFFFPNVLGHYILRPAMASVFPSFTGGDYLGQTISVWHGFNTEVWMTIGVIVLGTFIYIFLRYWKNIYKLLTTNWTIDNLYNDTLEQMEEGAALVTSFYIPASLRHHV